MSDGSGWVERVGATLTFAWRGSLGGVSTSGQVAATDSQRRLWAAGVLVTVLSVGEITGGGEPTEAHRWFTLGLVLVGAASVVFAAGVMIESMVDGRWSMVGPACPRRRECRETSTSSPAT